MVQSYHWIQVNIKLKLCFFVSLPLCVLVSWRTTCKTPDCNKLCQGECDETCQSTSSLADKKIKKPLEVQSNILIHNLDMMWSFFHFIKWQKNVSFREQRIWSMPEVVWSGVFITWNPHFSSRVSSTPKRAKLRRGNVNCFQRGHTELFPIKQHHINFVTALLLCRHRRLAVSSSHLCWRCHNFCNESHGWDDW